MSDRSKFPAVDYRLPYRVKSEEEDQRFGQSQGQGGREPHSEQHLGQMGDVGYRGGHREWQQRDLG